MKIEVMVRTTLVDDFMDVLATAAYRGIPHTVRIADPDDMDNPNLHISIFVYVHESLEENMREFLFTTQSVSGFFRVLGGLDGED